MRLRQVLISCLVLMPMIGCGLFGSQNTYDSQALKTSEELLLVDVFFVDNLSYYKGDALCSERSYGRFDGIRDRVQKALGLYYPVSFSERLRDAYQASTVGVLSQGCMSGMSMMSTMSKQGAATEDARMEFARLASEAAQKSSRKFDLYAKVWIEYSAVDFCPRGGDITGMASKSELCKEPKEPSVAGQGSVSVRFEIIDLRGTVNKTVYSDASGFGFGVNAKPKAMFSISVNDQQVATSEDTGPKGPFDDWKRPESYSNLTPEQKSFVLERTVEATDQLFARFLERMKKAGVANRTVPSVVDIDTMLEL